MAEKSKVKYREMEQINNELAFTTVQLLSSCLNMILGKYEKVGEEIIGEVSGN